MVNAALEVHVFDAKDRQEDYHHKQAVLGVQELDLVQGCCKHD